MLDGTFAMAAYPNATVAVTESHETDIGSFIRLLDRLGCEGVKVLCYMQYCW